MSVTSWIDFSSKHGQYIQNPDGSFSRMDEPFFESEKISENTWKILSSGDFSYLVAGEEEAIAIDTGYGAGNIRKYMQSLTDRPLRYVVNTHDHFDHTANNGYFDKAFLSEETAKRATIPFPSFDGIVFPRNYEKEIVREGDEISLGGRELLVLSIPDHAVGSIALLDWKARLLFTGDEVMPGGRRLNGSLSDFRRSINKLLDHRNKFDRLCTGPGVFDGKLLDQYGECLNYIAAGHEGEIPEKRKFILPCILGPDGSAAYHRRYPHPEDIPADSEIIEQKFLRRVEYAGIEMIYDIRLKQSKWKETLACRL